MSLSSVAQDQSLSEVLLIGNEGLVGLSAFLGSMDANNQTVVLVAGAALRIKKTVFDTEVHRPGALKDQLLAYTHIRLENLTQNVACKSHHKIQQQLARWLLSIHDRIEGKRLLLTQPYIAQRFGVRRASITEAAVKLQETGCISYRRGEILIVDPEGLEAQACSCYRAVKSMIAWEHHADTASDPCNATVDFKGATVPKSE
ncbi:MAG: Crp/Fnr family transcriptional regulator [Synechocystis sp.]